VAKDAKCSSCDERSGVQTVTVRLYRRRAQLEFRYRLCPHCVRLLESLLEANAEWSGRGLFDHSQPAPTPMRRRA
jgi:hypothetical protein